MTNGRGGARGHLDDLVVASGGGEPSSSSTAKRPFSPNSAQTEAWDAHQQEQPLGITRVEIPADDIFRFKEVTYFILVVIPEDGRKCWHLTKRYNDFLNLRKSLGYPATSFPDAPFPRKHLSACEDVKLEKRREGLESWLDRTMKDQLKNSLWTTRLGAFLEVALHTPVESGVPSDATPTQPSSLPSTSSPPDFRTDSEGWFRHFDAQHKGLTKEEFSQAVSQSCSGSDKRAVSELISSLWTVFGLDAHSTLTFTEFHKKAGFREAILLQLDSTKMERREEEEVKERRPRRSSSRNSLNTVASQNVIVEIEIPPGVVAGQTLQVGMPNGREVSITVPFGASAGETFKYEVDPSTGIATRSG